MVNEIINGAPQTGISGTIVSLPRNGEHRITNLFVDSETGKIVIEYEDDSD